MSRRTDQRDALAQAATQTAARTRLITRARELAAQVLAMTGRLGKTEVAACQELIRLSDSHLYDDPIHEEPTHRRAVALARELAEFAKLLPDCERLLKSARECRLKVPVRLREANSLIKKLQYHCGRGAQARIEKELSITIPKLRSQMIRVARRRYLRLVDQAPDSPRAVHALRELIEWAEGGRDVFIDIKLSFPRRYNEWLYSQSDDPASADFVDIPTGGQFVLWVARIIANGQRDQARIVFWHTWNTHVKGEKLRAQLGCSLWADLVRLAEQHD